MNEQHFLADEQAAHQRGLAGAQVAAQIHTLAGVHIYHFDLYRLGDPEELEMIGIRDYFDGHALCVLEWPERGSGVIPPPDLTVTLAVEKQGRYAKLEWADG